MMKQIDLFSGIGGFALAAHWAGFQTEVFCERDEYCQNVLKKHWPTVPVVSDIREFDGTRYSGSDLLTGGFPCQPFSCAGKQRGDKDDRFLWPEMLRVISEAKPDWCLIENVAGIINMALDGVLSDLEAEGYETQAFVIPACAVNAPHRRNRVWIVANTCRPRLAQWEEQYARPQCETAQRSYFVVSDTNSESLERTAKSRAQCGRGQFKPGLDGMADGLPARMDGHFDSEPDIQRVATGVKNRAARLKALGNAIVPHVAYEIMKAIHITSNADENL